MSGAEEFEDAWKTAHDALADHGRARIRREPETVLRNLWNDYCLRLIEATDADQGRGGLTDAEMAVLELLAEASRQFFHLPEHHPMDTEEWCHEVHALQHRVMARSAIRWKPDYFTPMSGPAVAVDDGSQIGPESTA